MTRPSRPVTTTLAAATLAALLFTPASRAAVTLTLSDKDATPLTAIVPAGGSFPVSVLLTSTSSATPDSVAAVDYNFTAPANGIFSIVNRNTQTSGSAFTLPYLTDGAVAGLAIATSNSYNLGARRDSSLGAVSSGTFEVADFTIAVAPGTPVGSYTLQLAANPPGIGYTDGGSNDQTYTTLGSFIIVVPEPATLTMLGAPAIAFAFRRRRRAVTSV